VSWYANGAEDKSDAERGGRLKRVDEPHVGLLTQYVRPIFCCGLLRTVLQVMLLHAAFLCPQERADVLADSSADFSGTQGFRSWYYGCVQPSGTMSAGRPDPQALPFQLLPDYDVVDLRRQQATIEPPWTEVPTRHDASAGSADRRFPTGWR
jgi:hypothetical protein